MIGVTNLQDNKTMLEVLQLRIEGRTAQIAHSKYRNQSGQHDMWILYMLLLLWSGLLNSNEKIYHHEDCTAGNQKCPPVWWLLFICLTLLQPRSFNVGPKDRPHRFDDVVYFILGTTLYSILNLASMICKWMLLQCFEYYWKDSSSWRLHGWEPKVPSCQMIALSAQEIPSASDRRTDRKDMLT